MVASVIQDNICIAYDSKKNTHTELQKLSDIKVSYQELICYCETCQQFSTKGCEGGNVEKTIAYILENGFVGGGVQGYTSQIEFVPDKPNAFLNPLDWKYYNCLSFNKAYCDNVSEPKCPSEVTVFDKNAAYCGTKTSNTSDILCVVGASSTSSKKLSEVRQKNLV